VWYELAGRCIGPQRPGRPPPSPPRRCNGRWMGFRVQGSGFRGQGFIVQVQGFGCRVSGLGLRP